jgi:hypothetical protein
MKSGFTHYDWYKHSLELTLIMLLAVITSGYSAQQDVFDVVPQPHRAQLAERLDRYIEYQRTKQYEKLYELYSRTTIERVFKNQTKQEFIAAFNKGDTERTSVTILQFTPTRIELTTNSENVEWYNIYGEARLLQQGELVKGQIMVAAQLEDGVWRFAGLADVLDN